jgi:hypothetical protein
MEALFYVFVALMLVVAGAVLYDLYGPEITAKVAQVKAAAAAVKADVEKL